MPTYHNLTNMSTINELKLKAEELKKENPRLRSRDAAAALGISEFEYMTLDIGPDRVLLDADWKEVLQDVHTMGYVMALTRNESCVHERKGVYDNISFTGGHANMGVAVNPDIDLRLFMNPWTYGLAVVLRRNNLDDLYSLQFYSAEGEAIHKIYSTDKSDLDAYHAIVNKYRAEKQEPVLLDKSTFPEPKSQEPNPNPNIEGLQKDWRNLKDTHGFFGLLRRYKVTRIQALENAPDGMAIRVGNDSLQKMLELAAERQVSIMCFTGNQGCIQIHTGPVKNLKEMRGWYNILDPKFNLHLKTEDVDQTWIVKKPTTDGIVTSVELFDKNGELITYFFGARKPGIPELETWREIVADTQLSVQEVS